MAAVITEVRGGIVAPHIQTSGTGLKNMYYSGTKAAQNDWVVLADFTTIVYAHAATISTGALTVEGTTIDATTANKLVFTSATTGSIRMVVWGY